MSEPLKINIPPDDVYRFIEAMNYYLESWKATEVFLRDGVIYDGPIHQDCNSHESAHQQVLKFSRTLSRFHKQLDAVQKPA